MDKYVKIRQAVMKDGISKREASRHFGVSRQFVGKATECPVPKPYLRVNAKPSKLDPYKSFIDAIVEGDKGVHKKQRHTAKRIRERLCEEEGFEAGYTLVKDDLQSKKRKTRESSAMSLSSAEPNNPVIPTMVGIQKYLAVS